MRSQGRRWNTTPGPPQERIDPAGKPGTLIEDQKQGTTSLRDKKCNQSLQWSPQCQGTVGVRWTCGGRAECVQWTCGETLCSRRLCVFSRKTHLTFPLPHSKHPYPTEGPYFPAVQFAHPVKSSEFVFPATQSEQTDDEEDPVADGLAFPEGQNVHVPAPSVCGVQKDRADELDCAMREWSDRGAKWL